MADFLLTFENNAGDLAIRNADIALDRSLRSAVLVSLFTDARVEPDELPDGETDRRGWWGQDFEDDQIGIGSKLWTLARSKRTNATLLQYQSFAMEALQWLVTDGHVRSVQVSVSNPRSDIVLLDIGIQLLNQDQTEFQFEA